MTTFADRPMIAWRDRTAPIPVLRLAKSIDPHVVLIRPPQSSIRFYVFRDGSVIETQGRSGRHTLAVRESPLPLPKPLGLPPQAIRTLR